MNQLRVDRYRINLLLPLEDVARLLTYIKGREVDATAFAGRKIRKARRPMKIGDLLEQLAHSVAEGVSPDKESLDWMRKHYEINLNRRKIADEEVKSGKFRKPKSEWKKPGRVPGKKYPKIDAAMKKLGEERRAMSASGKSWHKNPTK